MGSHTDKFAACFEAAVCHKVYHVRLVNSFLAISALKKKKAARKDEKTRSEGHSTVLRHRGMPASCSPSMAVVHTLKGILGPLHLAPGLLQLTLKLSPHLIQSCSLCLHLGGAGPGDNQGA